MLHMVKLCVGATSVEDLAQWQAQNFGQGPALHVTRMWPKRGSELLDGGALYWVIKGVVLARQTILGLEEIETGEASPRCGIVLAPEIIRTEAQPRRAFQGWRYLDPKDAPADLKASRNREDPLPRELMNALSEIGLR